MELLISSQLVNGVLPAGNSRAVRTPEPYPLIAILRLSALLGQTCTANSCDPAISGYRKNLGAATQSLHGHFPLSFQLAARAGSRASRSERLESLGRAIWRRHCDIVVWKEWRGSKKCLR